MTERNRLTPDDIGSFFDAAEHRRKPFKPSPAALEEEQFWQDIAEFLDRLEKQHPWKVRRVRSSLRWMFRQAHLVYTGEKRI